MQMTTTTRDDVRKDRAEEVTTRRKKRGGGELTGHRLAVVSSQLDHNKFVYRWINNKPGRIFAKTIEDDWEIVTSDGIKDDGVDLGNKVSQIVGTAPDGSALLAYLCRKPKQYYDEDQAEKSVELDKQLEQMRRGQSRSGSVQGDYIPHSGIKLG